MVRTITVSILSLCICRAIGFGGMETALPILHSIPSDSSAISIASSHAIVTSPLPTLLATYKQALTANPLETKMATGAMLALTGDAVAQSREEAPYDSRRALSFMLFDMCYRALQHNIFPWIVQECKGQFLLTLLASIPPLARMVSEGADPTYFAAMEQTLASQLGVVPFMYYPVFFALTGFVQGLSMEGAIARAKDTFIPLMKRNLLFWIPVQFVQFGFVEERLQIPFLCVCGLMWTFILSVMAGSTNSYGSGSEETYCVTGLEGECTLPEDLFPHVFEDHIEDESDTALFNAIGGAKAPAQMDSKMDSKMDSREEKIKEDDFVLK